MNINELNTLIEQRYINVQKHPSANLFIYNYSQSAQYESFWNDYTLMCRGLILDAKGAIVARPFPKFFNWEELQTQQIPNEPFEVYEKMDGSLGILYWLNNQAQMATRGSFVSEQAVAATQMLHTQYADVIPLLDKTKTYLFEIIYPENRIVVNYGTEQKLVLLAIIDTQTGSELPVTAVGTLPIVKKYDGLYDFGELKKMALPNKEGFVVKFKNGFRFKIKLEEYIRLHRILTNISNVDIWECLAENKPFDEFIKEVPDEFYDWVKATKIQLEAEYEAIEVECERDFKDFGNRKATAEYFLTKTYSSILFKMLDRGNYAPIIWKLIRPRFQKAFKKEEH